MPAFQLNTTTAALVSDTSPPMLSIVSVAMSGVVITGSDALQQLAAACKLALDAHAARIGIQEPPHEQ